MATDGKKKVSRRKQISVSLAPDVHEFIAQSMQTSGMPRARVVDLLIRMGQSMLISDEILQAVGHIRKGRTDTEHLERCRRLIHASDVLFGETGSQVLKAVAGPLADEIRKIDHEWLESVIEDSSKTKPEKIQ